MNRRPQLLIAGNGMAAGRLVNELLRRDPDKYEITVIGNEPQGSYNRIMLSSVLASEQSRESVIQQDPGWYQQRGIRFLGGIHVNGIDPESKCVQLDNGTEKSYDELVIATGSAPARIAAKNQHLRAIHHFRTLADIQDIESSCTGAQKAVVIGGGLLGLEAAYGLAKKGLKVTLVHRSPWLLNRQLDSQAAGQLQQVMSAMDIDFCLENEVEAFIGQGRVSAARMKTGEALECDLALIATGITPNIELAQHSDIKTERAIVVDELMRTSVPHVSALGECCEFSGEGFGLVEPIWQQCTTLADRLVYHKEARFSLQPIATKLKVSGVQVFSAGEHLTKPEHRQLLMQDPATPMYRKLLLEDQRIVGIVFFGDTRDGNWYFDLMQEKTQIPEELMPELILGKAYCDPEKLNTDNQIKAA